MTIEDVDEAMLEAPLNTLASALEPSEAELERIADQKRKTEADKDTIIRNVAEKIADNPRLSELFNELAAKVQQVVKRKNDDTMRGALRRASENLSCRAAVTQRAAPGGMAGRGFAH